MSDYDYLYQVMNPENEWYMGDDYEEEYDEEFNQHMATYKQALAELFTESHCLEQEIMKQLNALLFNDNIK